MDVIKCMTNNIFKVGIFSEYYQIEEYILSLQSLNQQWRNQAENTVKINYWLDIIMVAQIKQGCLWQRQSKHDKEEGGFYNKIMNQNI